ncbi:MAG: hydrogenase maturation protease [Candidatus Saccharibacteria bacterium]
MKKVLVVGIGNPLLQDEGLGVHVAKVMEQMDLPPEVEVIDGGTHTYDLVDFFCQGENLIVVDALQAGGEPGTIYRAPLEQLGLKAEEGTTSLHQMNFIEAMQMVNLLGHHPRVIVFGVEPKTIDWGLELTPELQAKMPKLLDFIQKEIQEMLVS